MSALPSLPTLPRGATSIPIVPVVPVLALLVLALLALVLFLALALLARSAVRSSSFWPFSLCVQPSYPVLVWSVKLVRRRLPSTVTTRRLFCVVVRWIGNFLCLRGNILCLGGNILCLRAAALFFIKVFYVVWLEEWGDGIWEDEGWGGRGRGNIR